MSCDAMSMCLLRLADSHKLLDDPKASLVTEGPTANAWWGQGKFSCFCAATILQQLSQLKTREQLLERLWECTGRCLRVVFVCDWETIEPVCPLIATLTRRLQCEKGAPRMARRGNAGR